MDNLNLDLRSDTVTKPTSQMMEAVINAPLGDDVFGEDPSVNALQEYAANLFGMEEALFCSSGTQTNQIAIKVHTQPADEVICHELAHVYLYEGGGIAYNSGASVRLLTGNRGMFTAQQVKENINKEDVHFPSTKLVCVENTMNKGGGACWDWQELLKIKEVCTNNNLAFHLDGARLFNALIAKNENPMQYGQLFDTISICLSKGLGAPVGSLLLGSKQTIHKAKRIRKIMGGGMRQAGILAAAGLFALQNNVDRLIEDHKKASYIESILKTQPYVEYVLPVETNLLVFKLIDDYSSEHFIQLLLKHGIKAVGMGKNLVRFVFHLNQTDAQVEALGIVLSNLH
ncbi:MAG: threonine aldolase [Bacteroidetes bacterium B1(2017)]|nr:MAG: threonine aldolase [Bacteroidetes bacterium B1(2017)]